MTPKTFMLIAGEASGDFACGGIEFALYGTGARVYQLIMQCVRYVYWQDGGAWLGYLEEYPDYLTQGESLADLEEHLRNLLKDLLSGAIPFVRKVAELQFA